MQVTFPFLLCALFNAAIRFSKASESGLLRVIDVSENSAVFDWDAGPFKNTMGRLKMFCTGSSEYTLASGAQQMDYFDASQALPPDVNRITVSDLNPNTDYGCVLYDTDYMTTRSNAPQFSTCYSDPSPPPAPLVFPVPEKQLQNQSDHPVLLQLDLLPTSSKYGPIHGYELQFVAVLPHEVKSGKIKHPIQHQLGPPYGSQNSIQDAKSAEEAVDFAYKLYKNDSLPTRVNISMQLVGGALKRNKTYSAVLLAYTNDTVHRQILLSYSPFSKFFFIYDNRAPDEDSHFKVEYREALTSIVFGSALPVLAVVGFILLSVAIGWKVRQKRSRKGRRKQMLRPVFVPSYMPRPAEQSGEDCRPLLDETSDAEEQPLSSTLSPTSAPATAHPSTQTSEAGAVPHQHKAKLIFADDSQPDNAHFMVPVQPYMQRPDTQSRVNCSDLLDEASNTEEQLLPSTLSPTSAPATSDPSTQTRKAGAVPHRNRVKVIFTEDSPQDGAHFMLPLKFGGLRKGDVVEAASGGGFKYTEHAVNKFAAKWLNKYRRSVKYTKLADMHDSSDSERESRSPVLKRQATQILARNTIQTSTPTSGDVFPPLSSLSAVAHTLAEIEEHTSSITKQQSAGDIQLEKEDTSTELEKDAFQSSAMVQLSFESAPAESGIPTLSSYEKVNLLSKNQTKHLSFHPYCFVNPSGPEQLCHEKADHDKGEDTTESDYEFELARMYNRQYCDTEFSSDSSTADGDRAMTHCEPQAKGVCSPEWDLHNISSHNAHSHQLITVNSAGECPQFSPANEETRPGLLESDSILVFPQELSQLSGLGGMVDSVPSLLHQPSKCKSKETEGTFSADSFTSEHPLAHSSNLVLHSDCPSSPRIIPRSPNGPSGARPHTPLLFGGLSPNLLLPKEEGLLLLLQGVDTATTADSTASSDQQTVPSDVDVCSKVTLVGPPSSDQIAHP